MYAVYMSTLGNRPDLFPHSAYPNASTLREPTYYEIPPEALEDETFAAIIAEAESGKVFRLPLRLGRQQSKHFL